MCWLYDTGEHEAIHCEGVTKTTVLDALVYPLIAIRAVSFRKNGRIINEVSGGQVVSTEMSAKQIHDALPEHKST